MSTIELKKRVLQKIESLNEEYLLEEVLALIEFETSTSPIELSRDQKKAIEEAKGQIDRGEVYTNEEVDKEIEEWLKK